MGYKQSNEIYLSEHLVLVRHVTKPGQVYLKYETMWAG